MREVVVRSRRLRTARQTQLPRGTTSLSPKPHLHIHMKEYSDITSIPEVRPKILEWGEMKAKDVEVLHLHLPRVSFLSTAREGADRKGKERTGKD